jgi:hypothetical protein
MGGFSSAALGDEEQKEISFGPFFSVGFAKWLGLWVECACGDARDCGTLPPS